MYTVYKRTNKQQPHVTNRMSSALSQRERPSNASCQAHFAAVPLVICLSPRTTMGMSKDSDALAFPQRRETRIDRCE